MLRVNEASVWLLSAILPGMELTFVRDAVDWAFVTDLDTRATSLTPTTFADETVGLKYFMGAGPVLAANANPLV